MKNLLVLITLLFCSSLQAQWTKVNSNSTENLHDIYFLDSLNGYCVGGGDQFGFSQGRGVVLKTVDGGENWNSVFSQDSLSIQHLAIATENNYTRFYGFASKNGTPYLVSTFINTQFQNWSVQGFSHHANDVQVVNNQVYYVNETNGTLYRMQNAISLPILSNISIFGLEDGRITFLNSNVDSVFVYSITGDSILFSNPIPTKIDQNQMTNARVNSFGDTVILKVTYPGAVYNSVNRGKDWEEFGQAPEFEAEIINSKRIYALNTNNRLNSTMNAGKIWLQLDSFDVAINRIYFFNDSMKFLVGENGSIFKNPGKDRVASVGNLQGFQKSIRLYPKPTADYLRLNVDESLRINRIQLVDLSGNIIADYPSNKSILDLKSVTEGTYFLLIQTQLGSITKKLIVQR